LCAGLLQKLDDLSAAHVEVLTTTGKYFWIPTSSMSTHLRYFGGWLTSKVGQTDAALRDCSGRI